jgi:lipoprotein-anchoring transpeptidase ErfK/SrfK
MSALPLKPVLGAALSIAILLPGSPAAMAEAFTTGTFQIFGGMEGASGDIAAAQRDHGPMPEHLRSRVIDFASPLAEGSILVKTGARRLYFILPGGKAIEYHVGVGREGFTWSGTNIITRKAEWPDWRPPAEMIARERMRGHELAPLVPGGPGNPLGARALYIGDTLFRIHGTTEPWSIGQAVSSGCIRMVNAEVIDLYDRVALWATVVVEE